MHACGKETIAEADSGTKVLTYTQVRTSGSKETVDDATLKSYFSVDVS